MANGIEDTREAIESGGEDEATTTTVQAPIQTQPVQQPDPNQTRATAASGGVDQLSQLLSQIPGGEALAQQIQTGGFGGGSGFSFVTDPLFPQEPIATDRTTPTVNVRRPPDINTMQARGELEGFTEGRRAPSARPVREPAAGDAFRAETAGELAQSLFTMQPHELDDLRRSLYVAGFYGGRSPDSIPFGSEVPAELDEAAFAGLLRTTKAFEQAGETMTVQEVLDAAASEATAEELQEHLGAGAGGDPTTILADPAGLEQVLRTQAEQLGLDPDRVLNDDVLRAFTGVIHSLQRSGSRQLQESGEAIQPDPTGRALRFLEDRFGVKIDRQERVAEVASAQESFNGAADAIARLVGGG